MHEETWQEGWSLMHLVALCVTERLSNQGTSLILWVLKHMPTVELNACAKRPGFSDWTPLHVAAARGMTQACGTHRKVKADVFAPCALGAIINDDTLKVLDIDIIVGGANNQLLEPRHAKEVEEKGILYGPDYLVNAGGLINVYAEIEGWPAERSLRKAGEIYNTLIRILELATAEGITSAEAADKVAEQRMEDVRYLHRTELGGLAYNTCP